MKNDDRIFQMMIVPIITYSGMVKLSLTKIQLRKLDSIERRAREIIGNDVYIPHLDKLIKKKACVVVRKCLDKEICNNFQEYFEINEHNELPMQIRAEKDSNIFRDMLDSNFI